MSFHGRYVEGHTSFLKKALLSAFAERRFNGGRGSEKLVDDESKLRYVNRVFGSFMGFSGVESIWPRDTGTVSGHNPNAFHQYQGLWLRSW